MEKKRIKEIERWLDRYVNRECSKMEAVEGIDSAYDSPANRSLLLLEFMDDVEYMQKLYNNQKYAFAEKTKSELSDRLDDLMREQLTGK